MDELSRKWDDASRVLTLSGTQLTSFPERITFAHEVRRLNISNCGLTEFPTNIDQFINLESIDATQNRISRIDFRSLTFRHLRVLMLDNNQLTQLPDEISNLSSLASIFLRNNQLIDLPNGMRELHDLERLDLANNRLSALPDVISDLRRLKALDVSGNNLSQLSSNLQQLEHLETLNLANNKLVGLTLGDISMPALSRLALDGNPLVVPPRGIWSQGVDAIRLYFNQGDQQPTWNSKIVFVGEAGSGKTSLLRRLRDEPFREPELPTHGIEATTLKVTHPARVGIQMSLSAWDFGGQDIYHATHQFFLTDQALFVLVWNARVGYVQGRILEWLETIFARAPQSPVVIVATHIDVWSPELPGQAIIQSFPNVRSILALSNKTGEGLEAFLANISGLAAELPMMTQLWPSAWRDAAIELRSLPHRYMTLPEINTLFTARGISNESSTVLLNWLHALGDVLFYHDNPRLADIVLLKPQWVSEYLCTMLSNEKLRSNRGMLAVSSLRSFWNMIEPHTQDFLLRMAEEYDLIYKTHDVDETLIVVEWLQLDEVEHNELWNSLDLSPACRQVSLEYRLSSLPPGIPTWFIARSHRFSTGIHWRYGTLLTSEQDSRTLALIKCSPTEKTISIVVKGVHPYSFFAVLFDGIELTIRRYPGLKVERLVPCPGHRGVSCSHKFNRDNLIKALGRDPATTEIMCEASGELVSTMELMFGLHVYTQNAILEKIDELKHELHGAVDSQTEVIIEQTRDFARVSQIQFAKIMQEDIHSECPAIFILRSASSGKLPKLLFKIYELLKGKQLELVLMCQCPDNWHIMPDGVYRIDESAEWLRKMGPYVKWLARLLAIAGPLIAPGLGISGMADVAEDFKSNLEMMKELTKDFEDWADKSSSFEYEEGIQRAKQANRAVGSDLRALHALLEKKDPRHHYGGLQRIVTKEGHYMWVCDTHAAQLQAD